MRISRLSALIARVDALAGYEGADVRWVGASSEEAIAEVESSLGVAIVGSYRDFILATGGGGLDALYISPIPRDAPLQGCHDDTLHYRQDTCPHRLPAHLVVIQRDDDDNEPICLDTSRVVDGENPVVLHYYQSTGRIEPIADSFLAYYAAFLEPRLLGAGIA